MINPRNPTPPQPRLAPARSLLAWAALTAAAALAACSSLPADNAALIEARSSLVVAQNNPQTRQLAAPELEQASDAVALAEAAWTRRDSAATVDQLAYLGKQRVAIADQTTRQKVAEAESAKAGAECDRMRLDARTGEVDAAQRQVVAAGQTTREAELRAAEIERQVTALKALRTERGLVITLGDVLFDNNRADLRPGSARDMDQLVVFMKQYPMRKALVEGFTDSVGSEASNQTLSDRRAEAVRSALVERGVGAERVTTHGYGESHPVSGNDTASGRQANRRVEIVVSDDSGSIMAR